MNAILTQLCRHALQKNAVKVDEALKQLILSTVWNFVSNPLISPWLEGFFNRKLIILYFFQMERSGSADTKDQEGPAQNDICCNQLCTLQPVYFVIHEYRGGYHDADDDSQ